MRKQSFLIVLIIAAVELLSFSFQAQADWRDSGYQNALQDSALLARFQAGMLYELQNIGTSERLINTSPATLSSTHCLFGSTSVNLDTATVSQTVDTNSVHTTFTWAGGTSWDIIWTLDNGDLILQTFAQSPTPVDRLFFNIIGCDIANYTLIAIDNYGVSQEANAPFNEPLLLAHGGEDRCSMPQGFAQSLVTLFEGSGSGWFVEGRDPNIGPSNIRPFGEGQTADLIISKRFHLTTQTPELFEVRIRAYNTVWQDAVDPHIDWMQNGAGFVPIDQKPQTWVQNINAQTYCTVGSSQLTQLSLDVEPSETYLGRQAEYRNYAFDKGYPDYEPTSGAVIWINQARSLGFHVGVHVNAYGIDRSNTTLLTQMQDGLYWNSDIGDWDGTGDFAYCSPSYAPWRAYLINAINKVIDPELDGPGSGNLGGADVIYLDQTTSPLGNYLVNGVTGTAGVMLLEEEILSTYSAFDIVIQTEGFNPMASRHAGFALAEMPLGHPLSGYIFSHFIRIVPEGYMVSPTDLERMEAFGRYGYMLPGMHPPDHDETQRKSWLEIIQAFNDFNFYCDSRMSLGTNQLSGFDGIINTKAYFEKHANEIGLRVYQPYHNPVWVGKRIYNVTQWPHNSGAVKDWLMYDSTDMLGLDPDVTYYMDPSITLDQSRFHLSGVPANCLPVGSHPHEVGLNESNFRVFFESSSGQLDLYIEDDYDAYVNGQEVKYDRQSDSATASVSAGNSAIRAFQRSEQVLDGYWTDLQWSRPQHKIYMVSEEDTIYPPYGLFNHVGGEGFIIGKFPSAFGIRVQGRYGMRDSANGKGDGVLRINGTEILRIDPGTKPYSMIPFDIDISSYAGRYVMFEFASDGVPQGPDYSDWDEPRFVISTSPANCNDVIASDYHYVADFDDNCYVNLADFALMAVDWLKCVVPSEDGCESPWESAVTPDRIMYHWLGSAGYVSGRNELDNVPDIPDSEFTFGEGGITQLAELQRADGKFAIGTEYGYLHVRDAYDNSWMGIHSYNTTTGNTPVTSLVSRADGHVTAGHSDNGGTYRDYLDLWQWPSGVIDGDAIFDGSDVAAAATLPNGHVVFGTENGSLYVRNKNDITQVAPGADAADDGLVFGSRINDLAVNSNGDIVIGLENGWSYTRNWSDIGQIEVSEYNWGSAVRELEMLSNDNVAVGLSIGHVHVRPSIDLSDGSANNTSIFTDPQLPITAMEATSSDNLIIAAYSSGWTWTRDGDDIDTTPPGFVGLDGLVWGFPVNAIAAVPVNYAPQDCNEVISQDYGIEVDLDNDCDVDLEDFALFAEIWDLCNDPCNTQCEHPWE